MRPWPLVVLVAACAHAPIELPSGLGGDWQAIVEKGHPIGWYNAKLGAVIQSNETCKNKRDVTSLDALTRQLLVGYSDLRSRSQETVTLGGRPALHTVADVKLDGAPMTLDLYVVRRDNCILDLSYAAPPDRQPAGEPAFRGFVAGYFRGRTSEQEARAFDHEQFRAARGDAPVTAKP